MRWCRIDLHIHTPATKDYQEPNATYLDILRKAEVEGLDIIAFTDHNTISGYAAMKQEIVDLTRWDEAGRLRPDEKKRLEEYRRLTDKVLVLPGFELTATFGFHILAIFDPETPIRALEHVLLGLNVPLDALDLGETEIGSTSDVLTAYQTMANAGALVIAAHVNSSHGVAMFGLDFGGQTRIAYTQDPHLHALEVTDLDSRKRRTTESFFNGSKPQYSRRMHCIQNSDAHRITGVRNNLGVGERATEVLLPEVSFEALKDLFLGDDFTRTRPYRRTAEPFDYVEAAREQGPTIVQSFHETVKRRGGRFHAVLCDVVAFANTNGGTIYVGVSPKREEPTRGVENVEEAIGELRAGIARLVTPPIEAKIDAVKSRGKSVVRVVVPRGDELPYVLEGSKIYLRQESETSLAMRDELVALIGRTLPRQPASLPEEPAVEERGPMPEESGVAVEPPRTGVEIVETVERKGVKYHTMCDLRNGQRVHNVSRASARRLWRYAIALKEKETFQDKRVTWAGELGLWHKYLRAGRHSYDLVQKGADGDVRIYYGVTEDGIHGPWKAVVGMED